VLEQFEQTMRCSAAELGCMRDEEDSSQVVLPQYARRCSLVIPDNEQSRVMCHSRQKTVY
jgi:hypothetical protein